MICASMVHGRGANWCSLAGAGFIVALCAACEGEPRVDVDDGGSDEPRDSSLARDGGERGTVAFSPNLVWTTLAPASPAAESWTSPVECPRSRDPEFCGDCYGRDDFGPDSLGRGATGDDFGSISRGDFNGDGYPDIAVGAPGDEGGNGVVYVYLGTERGFQPWRRIDAERGPGFGYRTAATDTDADGYADLIVSYLGDGGGVVLYLGSPEGLDQNELWEAVSLLGPDGNGLDSDARMGESLIAGNFNDGDEQGDFAVGAPGYYDSSEDRRTGIVWIMFGEGTDAWVSLPSLGISPTGDDELGAVIAGASGATDLTVSAPGHEGQYGLVLGLEINDPGSIDAVSDVTVRATTAVLATPLGYVLWGEDWGHAAYPIWPFAPSGDVIANSSGDGLWRPIAVFDADADGQFEVFGVDDTGSTPPFHFFFDLYDDADSAVYGEPDTLPGQALDYTRLGFASVTDDLNGDGYDDVAIGAPGSGDGGFVFGYYGGDEERSGDDNGVDFEDDDRLFEFDQELAACDRCVTIRLPDGSYCPDGICLDQSCSPRFGCGDGWREPGATPARERCDDRNVATGDTCSPTCEPVAFLIAGEPLGIAAPSRQHAVAADSSGAMLVVWTAQLEASTEVRARRYDRYGVPVDTLEGFLTVAAMPGPGADPQPVVAGRGTGWTVAWVQPAGGEVGTIGVRTISSGATPLGPAVGALAGAMEITTLAEHPAIATTGAAETFIAWTDATDPTSPRVRYRWLSADLSPRTEPRDVAPGSGLDPVVAADVGGAVLVAWTEQPALDAPVRVLAQRHGWSGPRDVAPIEVASAAASPSVTARTGGFAIAWTSRATDRLGDISVATLPVFGALSAATTVSAAPAYAEVRPSIAGVGSGWIVTWEEPGELSVGAAAGGGAALPAEMTMLSGELELDRLTRDLTLTTTPRGTWVVWSGTRSAGTTPNAARSTWGYLLPPT